MAGASSYFQIADARNRAYERQKKHQATQDKNTAQKKILKIKELLSDPFIINFKELKQILKDTQSLLESAKEYVNCDEAQKEFAYYIAKFHTRTSKALQETRLTTLDSKEKKLVGTPLPLSLLPRSLTIKMTEVLNLREALSLRTTDTEFYSLCTTYYRMPSSFLLQNWVFFQPKIETYDVEGTPTLLSKPATLGLCIKYVKTSTPPEECHLNPFVFMNQLRRELLSKPKKLKTLETCPRH